MMNQLLNSKDHDSIRVLRLHSWKDGPLPVADFDNHASLSPSRGTLLLQSHHGEAMLVSLRSAKVPENAPVSAVASGPPPPPPPLNLNFRSLSSKSSGGTDRLHSDQGFSHMVGSGQNVSHFDPQRPSMTGENSFWIISDCASCCWSSSGEGYSSDKYAGMFKELLFVVGKNGIFIHAFPKETSKSKGDSQIYTKGHPIRDQNIGGENGFGRWINWGCLTSTSQQNPEPLDQDAAQRERKGFVTFEIDAQVHKHADVVVLDFLGIQPIIDKTISYGLQFCSSAFSCLTEFCEERLANMEGLDFRREQVVSEAEVASQILVERVFSGPYLNMVGLLLEKKKSEDSVFAEDKLTSRLMVLICRVMCSGLEWFSVIDPGKACGKPVVSQWPTFSFSKSRLYGLHESGSLYTWTLENACILAHIDVLSYCGLNNSICTKDRKDVDAHELPQNNNVQQRRNSHRVRRFVNMAMAPDSSLVAVTDSSAWVYVVQLDGHSEGHSDVDTGPFCSGGLSDWAVGSRDIYTQQNGLQTVDMPHYKTSYKQLRCVKASHSLSSSCLSGSSTKLDVARSQHVKKMFGRNHSHSLCRVVISEEKCSRNLGVCVNQFGIIQMFCLKPKGHKSTAVVKLSNVFGEVSDDRNPNTMLQIQFCNDSEERIVPLSVQGYMHFVTEDGLYVILPPLLSSHASKLRDGFERQWWFIGVESEFALSSLVTSSIDSEEEKRLKQWQLQVLDKALIYDGLCEAERIAAENGWSQSLVRLRRLQLALGYLQLDEIEKALHDLIVVEGAESGVQRVLFTALELILNHFGGDNELAQASRLLSLAARFATKLIGQYGMRAWKHRHGKHRLKVFGKPTVALNSKMTTDSCNGNLHQMSRFLEVVRRLQDHLRSRRSRPQPGKKEAGDELVADNVTENGRFSEGPGVLDKEDKRDNAVVFSKGAESLWLVGTEENISLESSGAMFNRWEKENMDLARIVREALRAGRLPLAVVQLHRLRSKDLIFQPQSQNTFKEVQGIGRAFVYELLCKGEVTNAMIALSRLGEDVEAVLRELAFGTVSRILRSQVMKELARLGCLNFKDLDLLERVSILEKAYPSGSFWGSYGARQRQLPGLTDGSTKTGFDLQLICSLEKPNDLVIACGEIEGVVLGNWTNPDASVESYPSLEELSQGYWVGAAVWLEGWDQRTLDRVDADRFNLVLYRASWNASLQVALTRNDWSEASSLLESVPGSLLHEGDVQVRLDYSDMSAFLLPAPEDGTTREGPKSPVGMDGLDVDAVEMVLPGVKLLSLALESLFTSWVCQMMEEKLAKGLVFLRSYWNGTRDLVTLLARAGILSDVSGKVEHHGTVSQEKRKLCKETEQAIHELVLRHCVRLSLPNLMAIYFDHYFPALDTGSSIVLQAVVGDCQWALWLLLSRIKGREYDASFANARTVLAHNFGPGKLSTVLDIDEFISTVDDMAMAGGEMMALCTLMHAPVALEKCLCMGSLNRYDGPSWQCTLENLRPVLQQYPTLWRALVASCLSPDTWCFSASASSNSARRNPGLAGYLHWREQIFSSACCDTNVLQITPTWLPKGVHRLLQLAIQGPIGGGQGDFAGGLGQPLYYGGVPMGNVDPVAWESALQNSIEDELYASSELEDKALGIEQHLRKGRAMAAFNSLLATRLQNLSAQGSLIREHLGKFQKGQLHLSSELHALLSPLSTHEEKYLASVLPLAIMNFENPVVVASCANFLELCGLPATVIRVDVAALCRIEAFCKTINLQEKQGDWLGGYGTDVASSLARALADEYMEIGVAILKPNKADAAGKHHIDSRKASKMLMKVLQMLEKASSTEWARLDLTPGTWLLNGQGDGLHLRDQQREWSERWSLVTMFCTVHHLPVSTVYLTALARDNDWVGFLAEAQSESCPLESLISVASREFTDARLQSHVLTVLKSLQAAWQKPATHPTSLLNIQPSQSNKYEAAAMSAPSELFEILAECENKKHPGTALLTKAKNLRWPLIAVVSSCFGDVMPLSCLTVWLEITAARETSSIKVNDAAARIAACVGAAVETTNALPESRHSVDFQYNRKSSKRRRLLPPEKFESDLGSTKVTLAVSKEQTVSAEESLLSSETKANEIKQRGQNMLHGAPQYGGTEEQESLSKMIAILCEQQRFFPLLKAFELFMPSSSLLPFIRFLQAFSQMRLAEASAHLAQFSARLREESHQAQYMQSRGGHKVSTGWITTAAITAADKMLAACPSPYELRCLLQLLAGADFGDGGAAAQRFRRLYWKVQLAEPALQQNPESFIPCTGIDDDELLLALERQGKWEQARSWAHQLELSGQNLKAVHHVTETQAEAMVAEWKEFLWDLPDERGALWNHCHSLFLTHSFPPQQAGLFFLKHAEGVESEIPPSELHGILLLALQWLSGSITSTPPSYPIHLLRELETRIWLLGVESEAELQDAGGEKQQVPSKCPVVELRLGQESNNLDPINLTAKSVSMVDNHVKHATRIKPAADVNTQERESCLQARQPSNNLDQPSSAGAVSKFKRKPKNYAQHKRAQAERPTKPPAEPEESALLGERLVKTADVSTPQDDVKEQPPDDQLYWEERVSEQELNRAVLSLLEVGQVSAARQLQQKLTPTHVPIELLLVEAALHVAMLSMPTTRGCVAPLDLHPFVIEHLLSSGLVDDISSATPLELLDALTKACQEGCGRGSCKRIMAVAHVAKFLDLSFSEAFEKPPTQLLQLLSLKAQDSLAEAKVLVEAHSMPAANIARILAESFLKGLMAAHRGGYMESSQREEGPSPLLWRPLDFLKWAELCQSEPEMGHALMRLVISGHDIPHACEVELLVRAHHFYMSSACLDGIDVLLVLAATRVESYISEGDFTSLARLVTGINNFQSLHFMLDILIENGQLELLLQKRAVVEAAMESSASVRGFRMAVLSTLKHFNPDDLDAFAMVFDQFDMKHEMAALVESRARKGLEQWRIHHDPEQSEELLEMMRYNVEAAEVWASVDAGNKARWNCAQASLISLQLRIPEVTWLNLNETNARRLFIVQSRFQEALVVAEAYNLNQPGEWVPVIWNQMDNPGWIDQFLGEFVAALPLPPSMLMDLARFYRAEVTARGDQIDFSSWLSPGGLPLDWAKYLGKSFRCLLKYVRDVRLRVQLATLATGFPDVLDVCMRILDKVPDTAGPLILRKGHGGSYLPLM